MFEALGFQKQSEAERMLINLVTDDSKQVITSLQLNQLASLTYHEKSIAGGRVIYEQMLDVLEKVFKNPVDVSVLTMRKSLLVFRHLLLFGVDALVFPARTLQPLIASIEQNYNTAVMAQQATGATGFLMRLKGGAVDEGGPCRDEARAINVLLSNTEALRFERNTKADPNSLVPVGSQTQVGFITDEARYAILQRRMEHARKVELKSNLAKSESSFGGGYNSKDGRAVVGAAHSLDEMIKEAQRKEKEERVKQQSFSDEPKAHPAMPSSFSEYQAPSAIAPPATGDLLSMDSNQIPPTAPSSGIDLLDFSAPVATSSTSVGQIGNSSGNAMIFSTAATHTATPTNNTAVQSQSEMSLLGINNQPPTTLPNSSILGTSATTGMTGAQSDRFAALDALTHLGMGTQKQVQEPQFGFVQPQRSSSVAPKSNAPSPLDSLAFNISQPVHKTSVPVVNTSSLRVSAAVDPTIGHSSLDDDDGGFVMGGAIGTGLEPVGPAPGAPPPPPPGAF